MDWSTLIAVGFLATGALAGAAWTDRRRREQRQAVLSGPPACPIPGLDGGVTPSYVWPEPGEQADRPLAEADRAALGEALADATTFAAGWADHRFVTDPPSGWAVVDHPFVLATPAVTAERELWSVLGRARRQGRGLVVAARRFEEEALDALAVNVVKGKVTGVAVLCPTDDVVEAIAAATGGAVIATPALRADYLPPSALGECATWVAGRRDSRLLRR